jgi:hypothetical protein
LSHLAPVPFINPPQTAVDTFRFLKRSYVLQVALRFDQKSSNCQMLFRRRSHTASTLELRPAPEASNPIQYFLSYLKHATCQAGKHVQNMSREACKQVQLVQHQAGRQVHRFTDYVGTKLNNQNGITVTRRGRHFLEAEVPQRSEWSPRARRLLHVSLGFGVGIIAAIVTLKVGASKTGATKTAEPKKKRSGKATANPGKRATKRAAAVKPGARMAEDINKKAQAAAEQVEKVVLVAQQGINTTAGMTKDACLKAKNTCLMVTAGAKAVAMKTKDAAVKATADVKEAAVESKAIYDAAMEGMDANSAHTFRCTSGVSGLDHVQVTVSRLTTTVRKS